MKSIEQKMIEAVNGAYSVKIGNTEVKNIDGVITVELHGNEIFRRYGATMTYSDGGYPSKTTASRLRALGADCKFQRRPRAIIFA